VRGSLRLVRLRALLERTLVSFRGEPLIVHGDLSPEDARLLREKLVARSADLLDAWSRIAKDQYDAGAGLKYNQHEGFGTAARHLLFDPLDPELDRLPAAFRKFRAQRSLRDVEASTGIWVRRADGTAAPEDEE